MQLQDFHQERGELFQKDPPLLNAPRLDRLKDLICIEQHLRPLQSIGYQVHALLAAATNAMALLFD